MYTKNVKKKKRVSPNNKLNDLNGTEWVQSTKSWFDLDGSRSKELDKSWLVVDGKKNEFSKEIEDHPASFPPKLIEKFILFFTKKGQTVLDPFLGIGSTFEACYNTDRNGIGIELNKKYAYYSKKRVNNLLKGKLINKDLNLEVINDDCLNIDKHKLTNIDFSITSPPYWNMLRTSRGNVKSSLKKRVENGHDEFYSNDNRDAGNIESYEDYLQFLDKLYDKIFSTLKKGAYIVLILQNIRTKEGRMLPVAWDVAKRLGNKYILKQEFIWCQDQKFLGCWGYPSSYVSNVHHHYCLVLQKPK